METGEVLVIDLFAGPGGLDEGISSCIHENGNYPFNIGVSVEKEASASYALRTSSIIPLSKLGYSTSPSLVRMAGANFS